MQLTTLFLLALLGAAPAEPRFVTEDIFRFWRAFDRIGPEMSLAQTNRILEREYFRKGSRGLKLFLQRRPEVRTRLGETIQMKREYYRSIRANTLALKTETPEIRRALARIQELYPRAKFPPVYFLIGIIKTGGTAAPDALLIGAEHWTRAPDSPVNELTDWERAQTFPPGQLPNTVTHELVHAIQNLGGEQTLLQQSLMEGMASFLAVLATGRPEPERWYAYGIKNEAALWRKFEGQMRGRDTSQWLYGASEKEGHPADLGYFVGYRICEAYYQRAADKAAAIAEMLNLKDPERFLEASGYAQQVGTPAAAAGPKP